MKDCIDTSNLTGFFLVATPQMFDNRFCKKVIYVCSHTEEGILGLIINDPSPEVYLNEIFEEMGLEFEKGEFPTVFKGGPVEQDAAFILYRSSTYSSNNLPVTSTTFLTRESNVLEDIARKKGPESYIFCLGYAGWDADQLEGELFENCWLVVPGDEDILFDTPPKKMWDTITHRLGVSDAVFSADIGHS